MRRLVLRAALLGAAVLDLALLGATLKGTVVERQTGNPLARALVVVQPVAGTKGATQSVRTDGNGAFEFPPMASGAYIVTASRLAFAPVEYGQEQWKAAGVPVTLEEGREVTLHIALPRFGAITGRVADENDVGISELEVFAYRAAHPPQLVAHAPTDDRGVFRLSELEPGSYLVRAAAKVFEDATYLPTFFRDSATLEGARPVEVTLDRDTPDIVVHPAPGHLFSLAGRVETYRYPRLPAAVTLYSDMSTQSETSDAEGNFQFNNLPPAKYELMAIVASAREQAPQVAFQEVDLDRPRSVELRPGAMPTVHFAFRDTGGAALDAATVQVIARRVDLWGESPPSYLRLNEGAASMLPGHWEFSLAPNSSYYVAETEIPAVIPPGDSTVKFTLSMSPASLGGTVAGAAAGAPVFLEHEGRVRSVRADIGGKFGFTGLAPGVYHLLSSFDIAEPDAQALLSAGAVEVKLAEGAKVTQDLTLR